MWVVCMVLCVFADDQVLFEENTQNRLVEAIALFAQVCESRYFENTAIILFLNKRDIFMGE
jgi:guanine nucleotide-binding protein G(i) subunit alpha